MKLVPDHSLLKLLIYNGSKAGQGVATYMSCVEAFATVIKIESSDQSPFGGPIEVTSEMLRINNQECMAAM